MKALHTSVFLLFINLLCEWHESCTFIAPLMVYSAPVDEYIIISSDEGRRKMWVCSTTRGSSRHAIFSNVNEAPHVKDGSLCTTMCLKMWKSIWMKLNGATIFQNVCVYSEKSINFSLRAFFITLDVHLMEPAEFKHINTRRIWTLLG